MCLQYAELAAPVLAAFSPSTMLLVSSELPTEMDPVSALAVGQAEQGLPLGVGGGGQGEVAHHGDPTINRAPDRALEVVTICSLTLR